VYIDATTGYFLGVFFVVVPFVSLIYTLSIKKYITATPIFPKNVYKDKNTVIAYEIYNGGFLPTPFVMVKFTGDEHYKADSPGMYSAMIPPKSTILIDHTLFAEIGGVSEVFGEVIVLDFLKFFKFKILKQNNSFNLKTEIDKLKPKKHKPKKVKSYIFNPQIIYDVPEVAGNGMFLRSIGEQIQDTDEDTDTAAKSFISTYVPGYEHREYIPGDSLKKINWKLSARTDNIMVRLDEPINAVKPVIYIDFSKAPANSKQTEIMNEELVIEACLACLRNSVKVGIYSNVCFYEHFLTSENTSDFIYQEYAISDITDVENLAVRLSGVTFEPENTYKLLPADVVKGRNLAVFTQQSDNIFSKYETYAIQNEVNVCIVSANISNANLNSTKFKPFLICKDRTVTSV
jgi:hypothetical protein